MQGWSHWGSHRLAPDELCARIDRLRSRLAEEHPILGLAPTADVEEVLARGDSACFRHHGERLDAELVVGVRSFESSSAPWFRYLPPEVLGGAWMATGSVVLNVFTDELPPEVSRRVRSILSEEFPVAESDEVLEEPGPEPEEIERSSKALATSLVGETVGTVTVQRYLIGGELQEQGDGPVELRLMSGLVVHCWPLGPGLIWREGVLPESSWQDAAGRRHVTRRATLAMAPTGVLRGLASDHCASGPRRLRETARGWELRFDTGVLRIHAERGPRTIAVQLVLRDGQGEPSSGPSR